MALLNGSTVLSSDLQALTGTALNLMQVDNAAVPLGHMLHFAFKGLVAATPAYRAKALFVSPDDLMVETIAVIAGGFTAASTVTVKLAQAGAFDSSGALTIGESLALFPTSTTPAVGAGVTDSARLLYAGGRARADGDYLLVNPAARTLLKGTAVQLQVSTTSVATTSELQVILALRTPWGRR